MKVYLASPWFKDREMTVYQQIIKKMRSQGIDVYAPIEHEIENAWDMPNKEWGHKVFMEDIDAIDKCDEVWVLNFGMYSDSGTAWECGYAYAKGKTVRTLLNTYTETEFSLMMVNGCDEVDSMVNYLTDSDFKLEIDVKQKIRAFWLLFLYNFPVDNLGGPRTVDAG